MNPEPRDRITSFISTFTVFAIAFAVRFWFVHELRDESYLGNIRVSDAQTYFQLAHQILAGTTSPDPYWQAPFYPWLLALVHASFSESLYTEQGFHVVIGALNCALRFGLTLRLFGERAAWLAAAIAVFYAPFWVFDVQPLPANVTVLLDLALVSVYLRFREHGNALALATAGFLLGLAIATHGLAIFTLPVFLYDLAVGRSVPTSTRRAALRAIAIFLAFAALAPAAISARNSWVAKSPLFVSYNAGINLYVGNSGDLERTLARRGGYEWGELFRAPYTSGAKAPADLNRFFIARTLDEFRQAPVGVLRTFGKKLLMAVAGSEQKRNFPIYPLRDDSVWLRALLFEVEAFGVVWFAFPAGLVLPLSLLGIAWSRRRSKPSTRGIASRALPGWIALLHVIGMLIFFPTARYRLPAVMLLLPYAGAALSAGWAWLAAGSLSDASARAEAARWAAGALLLLILVNPLASNVFRHPARDRAEHLYFTARWKAETLRHTKSESIEASLLATAHEAMRVDPAYPEPVELLAVYHLQSDIELSLAYLEQLDRLVPNDGDVQNMIRAARKIREDRDHAAELESKEPSPNRETSESSERRSPRAAQPDG